MDYPSVLRSAMAPPEARPLAQLACREISQTLSRFGHALVLTGVLPERDDEKLGLAVVIQIGAELALSTITLLDAKQAYGAAALLRQIVEVEYLAWALAEDPAEARRWVHADQDERWKFFRPKRLASRSKGRFRYSEFEAHCDRGGHPRPEGIMLLPVQLVNAPVDRERGLDDVWDDLTFHLVALWGYLQQAVEQHPLAAAVTERVTGPVSAAVDAWRAAAHDALVQRSRSFSPAAEADQPRTEPQGL